MRYTFYFKSSHLYLKWQGGDVLLLIKVKTSRFISRRRAAGSEGVNVRNVKRKYAERKRDNFHPLDEKLCWRPDDESRRQMQQLKVQLKTAFMNRKR